MCRAGHTYLQHNIGGIVRWQPARQCLQYNSHTLVPPPLANLIGQPHCIRCDTVAKQMHGQCCAASKLHACQLAPKEAHIDVGFAHMLCSSSARVTNTLVLMRATYSLLAQAVRHSTALDTVGQLASMALSLMTAGSED